MSSLTTNTTPLQLHRDTSGELRRRWSAFGAALALTASTLAFAYNSSAHASQPAKDQPAKDQPAKDVATKVAEEDSLILRDGRVIKGKFISETETSIKFRGKVAGIEVETDYLKSNILENRRAKVETGDPKKPAAGAKPKDLKALDDKGTVGKGTDGKAGDAMKAGGDSPSSSASSGDVKSKVYVMELAGKFGRDISQTPIRQAMEDAKKAGSEYVIVVMNNEWTGRSGEQLDDDAAEFDGLSRAADMDPVFDVELSKWSKPPKLVFWVKRAMGGAAFLPLLCQDIYFSSDGKMGGIGNLTKLFDQGDEVVKQKQYSLRLSRAEGKALEGGYSDLIVRAMAVPEFVLSYSIEGGQVRYFQRMPENPNEFLLTDDGKETNQDTDKQVVAGEGNDALTLNAKLAKDLLIAKGIVDTEEDLLFDLGLARNVEKSYGRSKEILKAWSKNVDQAERDIQRLLEETRDARPTATFNERSRSRGIEKNLWLKIIGLVDRYGEALPRAGGLKPQALDRIKSIDNEQQRDVQASRKK